MITKFLLPLVAVGLLIFTFVYVSGSQKPPAETKPPIEPTRNPFAATVAGSGMVEPETENISIGTSIAGIVTKVHVKVGQSVEIGDELFRLDDRHLQAELKVREAALFAAQAEFTRMQNEPRPESLPALAAQVTEAEANLADQKDQWDRAKELSARRVLTDEELLRREQAFRMAESQLARWRADLDLKKAGAWVYEKDITRAAIKQAEAQIEQTKMDIERLIVRALIAGDVLQLNVRPGEYVGAPPSSDLIVLGNVNKLHVRVDIDEYDIPRFNPGAPAEAVQRGEAKTKYKLNFVRVEPFVIPKTALSGDNTERVDTRVLQVIYAIEPTDPMPYVGQRLDVFVNAAENSETGTPEDG